MRVFTVCLRYYSFLYMIVLFFMTILLFIDEKLINLISSITNWNVPKIVAFRRVDEMAITIATQDLFNINSKNVRKLANKFVPKNGKHMISKGLTIMHTLPLTKRDVKDENQQVSYLNRRQ